MARHRRYIPPLLLGAIVLGGVAGEADASFINYSSKEINCKIVYYGSATAGLRENLHYIYNRTNPEAKGKMISLATEYQDENVVFFDFLPLSLGEIRGFKTRFHLYTVPGHVLYNASRLLILKGVDGVVFVADADRAHQAATLESWENLQDNLGKQGYDPASMPIVVQLDRSTTLDAAAVTRLRRQLSFAANPGLPTEALPQMALTTVAIAPSLIRARVQAEYGWLLPDELTEAELRVLLKLNNEPVFSANPRSGQGVFDTLKAIAKLVLIELKRG